MLVNKALPMKGARMVGSWRPVALYLAPAEHPNNHEFLMRLLLWTLDLQRGSTCTSYVIDIANLAVVECTRQNCQVPRHPAPPKVISLVMFAPMTLAWYSRSNTVAPREHGLNTNDFSRPGILRSCQATKHLCQLSGFTRSPLSTWKMKCNGAKVNILSRAVVIISLHKATKSSSAIDFTINSWWSSNNQS